VNPVDDSSSTAAEEAAALRAELDQIRAERDRVARHIAAGLRSLPPAAIATFWTELDGETQVLVALALLNRDSDARGALP
jgi:hypothetical protein